MTSTIIELGNWSKFIELKKQSDATSGAGSAYLSGVPEFTPGF
jgi:hypothetical protein